MKRIEIAELRTNGSDYLGKTVMVKVGFVLLEVIGLYSLMMDPVWEIFKPLLTLKILLKLY